MTVAIRAAMGYRRIMAATMTYIALHVRDSEACIAFYEEFCGMRVIHERPKDGGRDGERIVWMAERGREKDFILVFIPGGPGRAQRDRDFSHLGFALASRDAVDRIADEARRIRDGLWAKVEGEADGREALP